MVPSPHIEVHPVDPSIFGDMQLLHLEVELLFPYTVSYNVLVVSTYE